MNRLNLGRAFCAAAALVAMTSFAATPATPDAPAEEPSVDQQIQMIRSLTEAQRQATVAANVQLTDAEAAKFWPLYREYRFDVSKINDKLLALIKDYSEHYEAMTDAKAKAYTSGYIDVQKAQIDLKSKYVSKFDKVLSPIKTARVLQIETKLDALRDAGLAKTVPLVSPPAPPAQ